MQSGTIGYWVDQRHAGNAYVAEAVAVVMQFGFEQIALHRLEICIVPRNERSRRIMQKLDIRDEGVAERYLEINGTWEDHVRYGITARSGPSGETSSSPRGSNAHPTGPDEVPFGHPRP